MIMLIMILKYYYLLLFCFVFNFECFKVRYCYFIFSKKVECQVFCMLMFLCLDNVRVFCRIFVEVRFLYDIVYIVFLYVNLLCVFVWVQMMCCDFE